MGRIVHFQRHKSGRARPWGQAYAVPCLLLGIAFGFVAYELRPGADKSDSFLAEIGTLASPTCNIKGNISLNTGERIYHVPGQKYYSATRITLGEGERWFCSEAAAISAGWRKSRV